MSTSSGPNGTPCKLKIAYLFQQFPVPTETFAVSDIVALIAQGHEVTCYTMKFAPRQERALGDKLGVPVELLVSRPTLSGAVAWPRIVWRWRKEIAWIFRRIIRHWNSSPVTCLQALLCIPPIAEIADSLASQDIDVVHAFWSRHVGLTLPLLERRGAPVMRSTFVGAYDLVADDFITDLVTQSAEALVSHAEVNRPYLECKAPAGASIAIIHRGIPLTLLPSAKPRNTFQLLTASALVPAKNVETVIRSFAKARERINQLTLDVYGEGNDRPRLEKIADDLGCSTAISFKGHVSRQDLFAQMQQASIFLLLSKKPSERLPNVLKEALWAGCAVISSDSEGIEELIPDASLGIVVNPDDLEAVTGAILSSLDESEVQSQARRHKAREFIAANFSSDASMQRYVSAWRDKMTDRMRSDLSSHSTMATKLTPSGADMGCDASGRSGPDI